MLKIIAHLGVSCERAMFVLYQELGLRFGEGTQAHRVLSGIALEELVHTRAMSRVADLLQDQVHTPSRTLMRVLAMLAEFLDEAGRIVVGLRNGRMDVDAALDRAIGLEDSLAESVFPHLRPFIEPVAAAAVIAMCNDTDGHSERLKALRVARQAA